MRVLRRVLPAACGLLLLLTPAGMASSSSSVSEYPLQNANEGPTGIVSAPDGNLWFAETATNVLGSISPTGSFGTGFSGLYGPAQDLVVGPDHNLWFTEPGANRIGVLSLPGDVLHEYPTVGTKPWDIASGPDGNLWFTEQGGNGGIGQITPAGVVTDFTTGLTNGSKPSGITAGPDGNLWFTEAGNPGAIGRITPTTGTITEYSLGTASSGTPTSIVTGSDGNLWFTEAGNPGAIGRISPTTGTITEFTKGLTSSNRPTGITSGQDGNLYFTEAGTPGTLGEITPQGTITEVGVPTASGGPDTITTGPDGKLWFTEHGARGQVGTVASGFPAASGDGNSEGEDGTAGSGAPGGGTAPTAQTEAATHVTPAAARLNGTSPDAVIGDTYHFDWGTSAGDASSTRETTITRGTLESGRSLFAQLGGLVPGTTYHFRLVVSDCGGCAAGTSEGDDEQFTTPEAPAVGRQAVTGAVSGTVQLRRPHSHQLVTLTGSQAVPVGSLVDASRGRLSLTSALPHGRTQSATLWGGEFVVGQNPTTGMTTFTLAGALSCPAPGATGTHSAVRIRTMTRRPLHRSGSVRSLWAHDNHGLYTTRGNNSVATVRGTVWETIDTCAGTRTVVARGVVAVHDLHRHLTILVHAGHSYLARRAAR